MRKLRLTILALSFATVLWAFAQQSPEVGSVKLYRYGELLREHNIELTEPALLRALKNPDASVRYLAAMKLAEDKTFDATAAIREALAVEAVPRDQVNIALALGLLGDQTGREKLKGVCADRSFVPEFRLYAVRYMFDLHSQTEECLAAAEQIAESKGAAIGDQIVALGLLPQFQNLTPEESQKVSHLVIGRLADSEPVVRMAAGQSLASLGAASSIPPLEAAIAKEQDVNVRSVLEAQLRKLRDSAKEP